MDITQSLYTNIPDISLEATGLPAPTGTSSGPSRIIIPFTGEKPYITIDPNPDGSKVVTICIFSKFDLKAWGNTITDCISILEALTASDEVVIIISSPGGDVSVAAYLASAIEQTQAQTTAIAAGLVASAGTIIFCSTQKRSIMDGSILMEHDGSVGMSGKLSSVGKMTRSMADYLQQVVFNRVLELGLFTPQEIGSMLNSGKNVYLTSQEVVERTGCSLINGFSKQIAGVEG